MMKIMQTRIRLSPYDRKKKKLRLVIDGAKTVGTGLHFIQYINDKKPEKGINIIKAGLGLLSDDKDYSAVEAEVIALDRASVACHHWIYYFETVELISDFEG